MSTCSTPAPARCRPSTGPASRFLPRIWLLGPPISRQVRRGSARQRHLHELGLAAVRRGSPGPAPWPPAPGGAARRRGCRRRGRRPGAAGRRASSAAAAGSSASSRCGCRRCGPRRRTAGRGGPTVDSRSSTPPTSSIGLGVVDQHQHQRPVAPACRPAAASRSPISPGRDHLVDQRVAGQRRAGTGHRHHPARRGPAARQAAGHGEQGGALARPGRPGDQRVLALVGHQADGGPGALGHPDRDAPRPRVELGRRRRARRAGRAVGERRRSAAGGPRPPGGGRRGHPGGGRRQPVGRAGDLDDLAVPGQQRPARHHLGHRRAADAEAAVVATRRPAAAPAAGGPASDQRWAPPGAVGGHHRVQPAPRARRRTPG